MTIDRPTLAYLYGTMCNKCLESIAKIAVNPSNSPEWSSESRYALGLALRQRLVPSTQRARMLALVALLERDAERRFDD